MLVLRSSRRLARTIGAVLVTLQAASGVAIAHEAWDASGPDTIHARAESAEAPLHGGLFCPVCQLATAWAKPAPSVPVTIAAEPTADPPAAFETAPRPAPRPVPTSSPRAPPTPTS